MHIPVSIIKHNRTKFINLYKKQDYRKTNGRKI